VNDNKQERPMSKNAVTSFAGVENKTAYQKFTRYLEIHYMLWRSKGEGSGAAGPWPREAHFGGRHFAD